MHSCAAAAANAESCRSACSDSGFLRHCVQNGGRYDIIHTLLPFSLLATAYARARADYRPMVGWPGTRAAPIYAGRISARAARPDRLADAAALRTRALLVFAPRRRPQGVAAPPDLVDKCEP
jgi:hypothetical protein